MKHGSYSDSQQAEGGARAPRTETRCAHVPNLTTAPVDCPPTTFALTLDLKTLLALDSPPALSAPVAFRQR